MNTAVVILNWNGKKFLERFLPPLIASVKGDSAVFVADNASTDGSVELLKEKFPHVRTMLFSKNRGFTGGYNRALFQIDSEYYLLLNSDIEVAPGWLEPLEDWMDNHPECGICAPKLHSLKDRDMFEYAGAAGGYIDRYGYPFCRGRVLNKVERDNGQYDTPAEVFWASGACLMIRAELYRSLGGLDNRFFAHMEEIDLCWRAQLAGYKVNIVPASTVWHVGGGSLPQGSPKKLYLNYRNNLLMLKNNLAQTEAAALRMKGIERKKSLSAGKRRARRIIVTRMLMDGCSAIIYLLTFRFTYFKAVLDAHRDFRRLGRNGGKATPPINGKPHAVTGIYDGWIIPSALLFGTKAASKAEFRIMQNKSRLNESRKK